MKRNKKLLVMMIIALLTAFCLSVTALADDKEIANVVGTLDVEGIPNSALPIGSGYHVEVVSGGPSGQAGVFLKLRYPASTNYGETYISSPLSDGRSFVKWNNINFSLQSGISSWTTNQYADFDVIDDSSGTTVSSNNITLSNYNRTKIKEGYTLSPTFEVVDYNVDEELVDDDMVPYLTGYSSNDSFALTSNNVAVERVLNTASGKMTFRVTLPLRYTGEGNSLSFTMAYTTKTGTLRTVDCTTRMPNVITAEEEKAEEEEEEDEENDSPIPYIIVDSYSYGGTSVIAGEEFSLTLRLRNTSTTHSVENIVMSISPMGVFSMTSSSNTFHIPHLQAGSIMEKTVTLKAGLTKVTDDEDANSIDIKFTYQYATVKDEHITLNSANANESITLPVDFPDRFELGIPEYDSEVFAGNEMYLSVPMVNKGRSGVYNLTAYIRGDMANPGQSQYIGNLNAGTESSADFSVIFDEAGVCKGEIVVTYEDANMNPKEVVAPFSVRVMEMPAFEDEMPPEMFPMEEPSEPVDAEPENDPTRPIKIVLALLVGSMSCYVTVKKAKAKRSIFLDEDI
ncbi:MAG: hypothetical protein J5968_05125 [Oscillospiraceae bacterium]|nr:hypothetical protein [Oscillospiraceae bacterium]